MGQAPLGKQTQGQGRTPDRSESALHMRRAEYGPWEKMKGEGLPLDLISGQPYAIAPEHCHIPEAHLSPATLFPGFSFFSSPLSASLFGRISLLVLLCLSGTYTRPYIRMTIPSDIGDPRRRGSSKGLAPRNPCTLESGGTDCHLVFIRYVTLVPDILTTNLARSPRITREAGGSKAYGKS